MQVVVNSLLTNYQQTGSGKVILLLHGWGDSAAGLNKLSQALAENYNVVAIDLPGFGGSEVPESTWGLDEYADFVTEFLSKTKIQPYAVVGHSNGGAIAIRAIARGLKTDRLVLLASAGIRGEYKGRIKLMRYVTKAGKLAVTPLPKSVKQKLRRKVYTTVGSDMLVAEHLQETFKKVVEDDVRLDASRINIPTLLIYGDKDISTPVKFAEIFHGNIKSSKLDIIHGADHWLPSNNTSEVSQKILDFLK